MLTWFCLSTDQKDFGLTQDAEGHSTKGMAEIIIAKHRNGAIGDVMLKFKTELAKFTDMDDEFFATFDQDEPEELTIGSKMNAEPGFPPDKFNSGSNTHYEDDF